jgi:hypothetical protein
LILILDTFGRLCGARKVLGRVAVFADTCGNLIQVHQPG